MVRGYHRFAKSQSDLDIRVNKRLTWNDQILSEVHRKCYEDCQIESFYSIETLDVLHTRKVVACA